METKIKPKTGILQMGIVTEKLVESKTFYQRWLGWTIKFESEWFVLLAHPEHSDRELAFMLPDLTAVRKPYFQKPYTGQGMWLIVECEDIQKTYEFLKSQSAPIDLEIVTEEWGDTHFTMVDPNGIGVDFVQLRS
jgi:catechol 2,3-dioxygenase-like lactoylglutathione lyase family enzyme